MKTDLLTRVAGRAGIAILVLLIAAGSVFAAASTGGLDRSTQRPAEATKAPEPTEKPEATEAPEPTEKPEATEKAEAAETPDAAETDTTEAAPSADQLARVVARLAAAGIVATPDQLKSLAGQVGMGGAVRVLAFAHASGKTTDEIVAMFKAGKGWGVVARELKLSIGPGIGWIMGHGHGQGHGSKPDKAKHHGKPAATATP